MTALLEPFTYDYMLNAIWVSALVGGVCGFLSSYLMLKGWSLIGDALSHAIVPGVAGAYMLGLPFSIGAFLSGGLAAGAMLFLNRRTRLKEDAIIGLIFTSFFGLGLFMVSLSPTSVNIQTIVLGNILAISPEDTLQLAIIGGVWAAASFDRPTSFFAVFGVLKFVVDLAGWLPRKGTDYPETPPAWLLTLLQRSDPKTDPLVQWHALREAALARRAAWDEPMSGEARRDSLLHRL